jgi:hypothetical protein
MDGKEEKKKLKILMKRLDLVELQIVTKVGGLFKLSLNRSSLILFSKSASFE